MKINWFSPLPPARSGIAVYAAGLIPYLAENAELTLWTDQQNWASELARQAEIRRFSPETFPWRELNGAGINVFHIGNNRPLHQNIWEIARRHSGIVVLHDTCLQHFFADLYLNVRRDPDGYKAIMRQCYGVEGSIAAMRFCDGGFATEHMAQLYPLTPAAVAAAAGVVLHSAREREALRSQTFAPVLCLPLPHAPLTTPASHKNARPLKPPFRLAVFGLIGANRRVEALLEAWSGLAERDAFRLDLCGELRDRSCLARLASLGLEKLVTVHGYLSDERLHEKLEQAHFAVNLRYPTMGEASLSQLLIWEHALPALVTQIGWYAGCPEETVAFVRPEHEIEDIRKHLVAFLKSPQTYAAMGARGRRYLLEWHSPARYARELTRFAEEACAGTRPAIARLTERAANEVSAWGTPDTHRMLADRLSTEICRLLAPR